MPARKGYRKRPRKQPPVKRKYQRKKVAKTRQAFVEQKYKETPEVANVAPFFNLTNDGICVVPDVFEFMSQGDARDQMSGRWIYSKWLTSKMMIDFTPCVAETVPMTFVLYAGWCKLNLNPELPHGGGPIIHLPKLSLQQHVAKVLAAAYEDPLGTGDARRIQLIRKQFIKSSPRAIVGGSTTETFRQNKMINLKWNVQRKIRYNHCTDTDDSTYMQCNTFNWVPFIFFMRAPTDSVSLSAYPKVHYKHRHYFTDS